MKNTAEYLLMVGDEGALRLKLLNEMCNRYTFCFIEKNISLSNKSILDIGCGTGILSSEFAKRCLPNGRVVATDISEAQINLSKETSSKLEIKNITHLVIDARNIELIGNQFDIIYCRFLLAHLVNPHIIIEKITKLMHGDSILIIEEPVDIECLYCDPHDAVFDIWRQAMHMQVKISKADFTIGNKLPSIIKKNQLKIHQTALVQPIMDNTRLKQQLWLGIHELKPHLIQHGFASESQLDSLIDELKKFSNYSHKIGYFKYKQILAKLL